METNGLALARDFVLKFVITAKNIFKLFVTVKMKCFDEFFV